MKEELVGMTLGFFFLEMLIFNARRESIFTCICLYISYSAFIFLYRSTCSCTQTCLFSTSVLRALWFKIYGVSRLDSCKTEADESVLLLPCADKIGKRLSSVWFTGWAQRVGMSRILDC